MARKYWIVNLVTKEYFPCSDEHNFFDGDWRTQTPWPNANYFELSAQRIWNDQVFVADKAFYGYDLCQDGMLVGVYYDMDAISQKKIDEAIENLRRQHDVAFLMKHALRKNDNIINMDDLPGVVHLSELVITPNFV